MKKILTCFYILIISLTWINLSYPSSLIFDDDKDNVYFGGPAEYVLYDVGRLNVKLRRKLYSIDIKKDKGNLLIDIDRDMTDYELSSGKYLAITVRVNDKKSNNDELLIFDKNGSLLKKVGRTPMRGHFRHFSWSPDGKKIAYVTGDTAIEDRVPFYPNGIWIYDVEKDESKKLNIKGVKINWSRHDGKIYIQEDFNDTTKVSVYDPSSGKLSKSDKKGILFTDDGKYYFVSDLQEGLEYRVRKHFIYDNATNKPIYEFKREPLEWPGWGTFIRNSHRMLMWDFKGIYQIFDIDAKKAVRKSKSGLLGWNKDMTKVVVYEGGNKIHIDELLTGTRWQSIDIPGK